MTRKTFVSFLIVVLVMMGIASVANAQSTILCFGLVCPQGLWIMAMFFVA